MFEKEAEEYNQKVPFNPLNVEKEIRRAFQKGAEFGYNKAFVEADKNLKAVVADFNKANEWHYVKDAKPKDEEYVLIYTDLKNTYVARIPTKKDYFITRRGGYIQMSAVIAWKEIVLPKEESC